MILKNIFWVDAQVHVQQKLIRTSPSPKVKALRSRKCEELISD